MSADTPGWVDVDLLIDALNDTDAMRCCSCPSCNFYAPDYEQHRDEPCQTWELIRAYADAYCRATHVFPPAVPKPEKHAHIWSSETFGNYVCRCGAVRSTRGATTPLSPEVGRS